MITMKRASVPFRTGFQSSPNHRLIARETTPYDGWSKNSHRMPEMAGATAYGQMRSVRITAFAFRARLAIVAMNRPIEIETKATRALKMHVVTMDFK